MKYNKAKDEGFHLEIQPAEEEHHHQNGIQWQGSEDEAKDNDAVEAADVVEPFEKGNSKVFMNKVKLMLSKTFQLQLLYIQLTLL